MEYTRPKNDLEHLTWTIYLRCARAISRSLRYSARSLARLASRLNRLSGELAFIPQPGDLYIASYPRSGTTWLQMILYQLTTEGDMAFDHISQVIPFFERSLTIGHNLNASKQPRIFKTHLRYHQLPKGSSKFIYIARDGRDVLVSYFHFYRTHLRYRGTFDAFFESFIAGKVGYGSWFKHVAEWEKHAHDDNILTLRYEDLTRNLSLWLPRIAEFCGFEIPASKYGVIHERCSFAYMKRYETKFDFINEVFWERGFKEGAFLRQGVSGSWTEQLTPSQLDRFDAAVQHPKRLRNMPKLAVVARNEQIDNLEILSDSTDHVEGFRNDI